MSEPAQKERRENDVWTALRGIVDPDRGQDIVELGYISHLKISDSSVYFHLHLPDVNPKIKEQYQFFAEKAVEELSWVDVVTTVIAPSPKSSSISASFDGLKDVKHIIAVSSCKGGVGKSTVAVNLAFSLSLAGHQVGVFDADIYGPSLPTMVGWSDDDELGYSQTGAGQLLKPHLSHGVHMMSFGFVADNEENPRPAIMRGPIVSQVINQLLTGTDWGKLDYLILDLPPGTGDVQLTITQMLGLRAAVIVTTPQQLSIIDVEKGIEMFRKLDVPTICLVHNMAFIDIEGQDRIYPFGDGSERIQNIKKMYEFDSLCELPLDARLSRAGDAGVPLVISNPDDELSERFSVLSDIVRKESERLLENAKHRPVLAIVPGKGITCQYPDQKDVKLLQPNELRAACECAHCVNEFTGERTLDVASIPADIEALKISPVGNYAVSITWSDGHASIFPLASRAFQ